MALPPKPLSSSPASSFYAFQLVSVSTPRPVFPNLNSKKPPTLIICKSAHTPTPGSPVSTPEPNESDPSAPTRGDIFLRRHWSAAASATILEEIKKKKKKDKAAKISSVFNVPSCYGCGASLQSLEIDAPGYVDTETYNLKKKHRQLKTILCGRCKLLSHGHMITAVGGNGGYPGGKPFVTAEELRAKLSHLRHGKALVVKLVDIVDFNGSFLSRIRDLVGANPIILVITKVDLLPKGTDLNCVGDWVVEATLKKKLTVLSVHLTSSKSLVGITGVVSEIQKEKKGRDVYILGAANVGKSAFINALLKMLSYKNPEASAARKYKPVQSAVPGTTLGPIQIKAFSGGGNLFDTPGLHLHHRQAAVIHSQDLPVLAPQSRLRGLSFPNSNLVLDSPLSEGSISNGLAGLSIFWGGLVRIDVTKVLPETRLTFYGPKALRLHVVPTEKADEFYQKGVGTLLMPPCGKQNTERWMGLDTKRELRIQYHDIERPACDVAISGLGWILVEPFASKSSEAPPPPSPVEGGVVGEIGLVVHVPKPVEIFVRPPLPVGSVGGHWYEYRELDEIEQEIRPKWHF